MYLCRRNFCSSRITRFSITLNRSSEFLNISIARLLVFGHGGRGRGFAFSQFNGSRGGISANMIDYHFGGAGGNCNLSLHVLVSQF